MATIQNNYVGDGSTTLYSFTFPYISITDIVVTLDDVVQDQTTEYVFANATTVQFTTAPATGVKILIRRYTSTDDVSSVFFPGSAIRARDLNDNFVQSLYVSQESTVTSQEATDSSAAAEAAALAAQAAADDAADSAAEALVQAEEASGSAAEAANSANTAISTANTAVSTANAAEAKADQSLLESAAALEAVSEALLYTLVPDVASIPSSPDDGDAVEVLDSTGIESFSPLTGLPTGFVGNSELFVRILYSGTASSWSFISYNASSPEDRYVTRSGDNMTGDLTLGTDKITLDATGGSITATGTATFGNIDISSTTTKGVIAYSSGHVVAQRDNLQAGGSGVFSGYKGSTRTSIISNDGSASFAGDVNVVLPGNTSGTSLLPTGGVTVQNKNGTNDNRVIWEGINWAGDTTSSILANGSATFAGSDLTIRDDGMLYTKGDLRVGGSDKDNPNIFLRLNGSASFAGTITRDATGDNHAFLVNRDSTQRMRIDPFGGIYIGDFNGDLNNTNATISLVADGSAQFGGINNGEPRFKIANEGQTYINTSATNASTAVFQIKTNNGGASVEKVKITADGSGVFNGPVRSGAGSSASDTTVPCSYLQAEGGIYTFRAASNSTDAVFTAGLANGTSSPDVNVRLVADGSAIFTDPSNQNVKLNPPSTNTGVGVYDGFDGIQISLNYNGSATFNGTVTSANSFAIQTEADDDTKYTTTTDSEGVETRVYNGAVLDVKDRIQNVLARMDAIEANEITDDATDSALLTLIANLSARLDERDTAIAALTARVATLES